MRSMSGLAGAVDDATPASAHACLPADTGVPYRLLASSRGSWRPRGEKDARQGDQKEARGSTPEATRTAPRKR